jgi:hypothetical protein
VCVCEREGGREGAFCPIPGPFLLIPLFCRRTTPILSSCSAAAISAASQKGFLLDHLDEWESFVGQPGAKQPRLYKVPFAMQVGGGWGGLERVWNQGLMSDDLYPPAFLLHTHTHTHFLSLPHTHFLSHTFSLTPALTHTLSLSLAVDAHAAHHARHRLGIGRLPSTGAQVQEEEGRRRDSGGRAVLVAGLGRRGQEVGLRLSGELRAGSSRAGCRRAAYCLKRHLCLAGAV